MITPINLFGGDTRLQTGGEAETFLSTKQRLVR